MGKLVNYEAITMSQESDLATDRLRRLKEEIDAKLIELSRIQASEDFVREASFVAEFDELMKKYQFNSNDAFAMLDPGSLFGSEFDVEDFFEVLQRISANAKADPETSKGRPLMRYQNPFTGEVVETKGTNHKKLREWKATHGRQAVEAWKIN